MTIIPCLSVKQSIPLPYECTVLASCTSVQTSEWAALPELAYSSFTALPRSRPSSQLCLWFVKEKFHGLTSSTPQVFCPGLPAGASQLCPGLGQAPNLACTQALSYDVPLDMTDTLILLVHPKLASPITVPVHPTRLLITIT